MGQDSRIEWTHHTFNPWLGCAAVSPGCAHCYAEAWAKRVGGPAWGRGRPRRRTSASTWRQPLLWNRRDAAAGVRERVFVASLADVGDPEVPAEWRDDLWELIDQCRHLDWLLLTKRPAELRASLPWPDNAPWPQVWLGVSAEDQRRAEERVPELLATPAARRFVSAEPLLEPVDLTSRNHRGEILLHALTGEHGVWGPDPGSEGRHLDWVIVGGESGPGARLCRVRWIESLLAQCVGNGVAAFVKQLGDATDVPWGTGRKGNDTRQWPSSVLVRRVPPSHPSAAAWATAGVLDRSAGQVALPGVVP